MNATGLLLLLLAATPAKAPPPPASTAAPASASAPAPTPAPGAPLPATIEADVFRYNVNSRKVVVTGKPMVTLRRGDMTLTCRKLVGDNDEKGQLVRATCEGDVKLVRATRTVTCDKAQYDRDGAKVICDGGPMLRDGDTEVRGKRLTYFLDADEVVLEEAVQAIVPSEQIDQGARKAPRPAPAPGKPPATAPTMGPTPRPTGASR